MNKLSNFWIFQSLATVIVISFLALSAISQPPAEAEIDSIVQMVRRRQSPAAASS